MPNGAPRASEGVRGCVTSTSRRVGETRREGEGRGTYGGLEARRAILEYIGEKLNQLFEYGLSVCLPVLY
jgi:hypothetical protein